MPYSLVNTYNYNCNWGDAQMGTGFLVMSISGVILGSFLVTFCICFTLTANKVIVKIDGVGNYRLSGLTKGGFYFNSHCYIEGEEGKPDHKSAVTAIKAWALREGHRVDLIACTRTHAMLYKRD